MHRNEQGRVMSLKLSFASARILRFETCMDRKKIIKRDQPTY